MAKDRFFNVRLMKYSLNPLEGSYHPAKENDQSTEPGGETETPLVDIYEEPDAVVIEADLPGIKPSDVAVRLLNNHVIIEGRRGERQEEGEGGHFLRMERCIEDFRRIIPLPAAINQQMAEANYQQGVLILRFPRIKERRNRAIRIHIK